MISGRRKVTHEEKHYSQDTLTSLVFMTKQLSLKHIAHLSQMRSIRLLRPGRTE